MSRYLIFIYGAGSYLAFLATFLYAIGFIGNFGVPKSMDSTSTTDLATALMTDIALLGLFAVQHSVMARKSFKRFLTRFIPAAAERSTYVLASSAALMLMFWKWEPLGGVVWSFEGTLSTALFYSGYTAGWLLVLIATFVINHFELFGLSQVWRNLFNRPPEKAAFVTPLLYRIVRHPLYVGWLMVFWFTPSMTVTHLLFAAATTGYILIAIQFEERDLMREHPEYAAYRKTVPMLMPKMSQTASALSEAESRL